MLLCEQAFSFTSNRTAERYGPLCYHEGDLPCFFPKWPYCVTILAVMSEVFTECQHVFQSAFFIGIPSGCDVAIVALSYTNLMSDDVEDLSIYVIVIYVSLP